MNTRAAFLLYALSTAFPAIAQTVVSAGTSTGDSTGKAARPSAAQPNPSSLMSPGSRNLQSFNGWNLYVEEDLLFAPRNEDRNYTGGIGLRLYAEDSWIKSLCRPLELLDGFLFAESPHEYSGRQVYSVMTGLTAFTPDSLKVSHVVPDDRPYASLIFFTLGEMSVNEPKNFAVESGLTFGMLGLRTAEGIQSWIHSKSRARSGDSTPFPPRGWAHQISDGGEPTLLYHLAVHYKLLEVPDLPDVHNPLGLHGLQWICMAEANAGYYTDIAFGSSIRAGRIRSRFWQFNSSPMTSYTEGLNAQKDRWHLEAYLFGSTRMRVVGYNALLQGQFGQSDYTLGSDRINRLIQEFDFGAAANVKRINLAWVIFSGRTAEFDGPMERSHYWGSVFLSYQNSVKL